MAKTVLVVDDDEGYLLAASRLLESADYEVMTARSAQDARSELEEQLPDLILLDVLMPAEDGFTFAEKLSRDETCRDVPVVLVTAVADHPGQMMYAFEQGDGCTVTDILMKSEVHEQLLDKVEQAFAAG